MTSRYIPDAIDRQITGLLHEDGRTSNRAIGRQLGLSEAAIRKRLKRLTDNGLITYGLLIDVAATNMQVFGWMYLEVHPAHLGAAYKAIGEMERSSSCAMKTGNYNLIAHMYAKDQRAMTATIEDMYRIEGVTRVTFRQVNKYPAHRHEFIVDTSDHGFRSWHGSVVHTDRG
ncbi:Lrp/AsnC family transcriptional regulator [Sphingopyxis sp. KK2]|uniref:Lrp/AsnC family transcriptional regulator n=1 Tax=Sphingopyxis sp. KK2 TaxID=1855727 RepID=UPI00097E70E9|nr:Lrp/AsnC family transcriptional regulator [Sphingopyxis sp. KK2]